jgi:MucB/RseB N-terminal domain
MLRILFLLFSTIAMAADDPILQLSTADEVVAKMMSLDNKRQASLYGFTAVRRYVLENQRYHKRAEMLVRVTCLQDGSKQFETLSEAGWGGARKHVFPRLLEAETEASRPGSRERSRIIPENYTFKMDGAEYVDGRPAYVMTIAPRTPNKYLMKGRVWIDAEEYAILRIEGKPAKNPSFWIKSVHFVHNYEKRGSFWFPVSDRSVTDARIFGSTEVTIEYFDYAPNTPSLSATSEPARTGLP